MTPNAKGLGDVTLGLPAWDLNVFTSARIWHVARSLRS